MRCPICGEHSHFYISQTQSIVCAVMQVMTAVGNHHVCSTLTNTHLVNLPIKQDIGYHISPVTKKVVFLPTEPTIRGGFFLSFRFALCYCLHSFQVRRHSLTLQFHAELRFDPQTVADWSQFCCKAMSNFILKCSLQLFLMVVGRGGNVVEI